jgi:hypothetical protein
MGVVGCAGALANRNNQRLRPDGVTRRPNLGGVDRRSVVSVRKASPVTALSGISAATGMLAAAAGSAASAS